MPASAGRERERIGQAAAENGLGRTVVRVEDFVMPQTVVITGSSSGLGRATAKLFQANGWNVVATMRTPEAETELTGLDRTLVTRLDLRDTASIGTAVDAGRERFGRIDALVNNAGYGAYGPLEVTPLDKIRRQFEVNVIGLLETTKAVLPHLRAQKDGVVVNVSSIGGRVAFPLGALYHGSKFAVEGISESLAYELGALGIRVKIIEPGGMSTDFGGRSLDVSTDPAIGEYGPILRSTLDTFGPMLANGSTPEAVAEVVYAAATDGTSRLRYAAGADVEQVLTARRDTDDDTFFAGIRSQFGL
jgi:NAD(P)-dependent dehydrogenase (short-subunit alcohol dehydrogenase family)